MLVVKWENYFIKYSNFKKFKFSIYKVTCKQDQQIRERRLKHILLLIIIKYLEKITIKL